MTPSGRRRRRKPRRTQLKNEETSVDLPCKSTSKNSDHDMDSEVVDVSSSGCSTPKAQRFRIPEILTCPPAPKKRRVVSNCSLQRAPIAFFAPPDIELFFFFALGDISV
uniref:Cyclin-dependent protein kinase inhibitor SMR13 n=1 Tax=Davidia involucrata TaxID=16924 RepID=A0A5B7C7L8_DAVIN